MVKIGCFTDIGDISTYSCNFSERNGLLTGVSERNGLLTGVSERNALLTGVS